MNARKTWHLLSVLAWGCALGLAHGSGALTGPHSRVTQPCAPPSVLFVVMDDVGTDAIEQACTPELDRLADCAVRFSRAYAMPTCSPTRSCFMTGRRAYRHGVGAAVLPSNPQGLDLSEWTLLEHFASNGYAVSGAGKWHLGSDGGPATDPNSQGCADFRGSLGGLMPNYYAWNRTVNGVTAPRFEYVTTRTAIDAAEQIMGMPEPWFAYVSFNAAHKKWHPAPPPVCTPSAGGDAENFRSMVENLDAHIGALVDFAVQEAGGNLAVVVYGDNGTPAGGVPTSCVSRFKGLVRETGIRVPLYVYFPGVPGGDSEALVSPVDIFATLCDLAGLPIPASAEDSISFAPALLGLPSSRDFVFSEWFNPNGVAPGSPTFPGEWRRAVVEERWKLIRNTGGSGVLDPEAFHDLEADPCESVNLLGGTLTPEQAAAYNRLGDRLALIEAEAQ